MKANKLLKETQARLDSQKNMGQSWSNITDNQVMDLMEVVYKQKNIIKQQKALIKSLKEAAIF